MASSITNPAWLKWMTALMGEPRQPHAAALPQDRFYCLLDELPLHLLPSQQQERFLRGYPAIQALHLNPDCTLLSAVDFPHELSGSENLISSFALQGTIAWVREGGASLPFWLGPRLEHISRDLGANQPAPLSLTQRERGLLAAAGILVSEDRSQHLLRKEMLRQAGRQFQQRGYAPISNLIHPFHVAALRRYYRHLIRIGRIQLGDRQSPLRYVAHNEPVARFFHHQIAATLSVIAGEVLRPSYVYLASYLSGAELRKHVDREQCEFSVTLCLDFSPEPPLATPWPISLDTPTGTVTVYQALGDGLVYRGTQLPHYRGPLGEGQTSTSIFFHYVAADFQGQLA
jgi:hypothetical protein